MARVTEIKPASEAERVEAQFRKAFEKRIPPERIVRQFSVKKVDLTALSKESKAHHRTEKQLLNIIHRFAIVAGQEGSVEFPPDMVKVINAYQIKPAQPGFSYLPQAVRGNRRVLELVQSHHRKTLALCKKVEKILGVKGVGGVAKSRVPRFRLAA